MKNSIIFILIALIGICSISSADILQKKHRENVSWNDSSFFKRPTISQCRFSTSNNVSFFIFCCSKKLIDENFHSVVDDIIKSAIDNAKVETEHNRKNHRYLIDNKKNFNVMNLNNNTGRKLQIALVSYILLRNFFILVFEHISFFYIKKSHINFYIKQSKYLALLYPLLVATSNYCLDPNCCSQSCFNTCACSSSQWYNCTSGKLRVVHILLYIFLCRRTIPTKCLKLS